MNRILTAIVNKRFELQSNIWQGSQWHHISDLENDYVGKVGEEFLENLCSNANIQAKINGMLTKERGGGNGDGFIKNKSVEIKTARQGSSSSTFQHELGETPWKADYIAFIDISPNKFYITLFPNFSEEFYKKSGENSKIKCDPIFPSKSITWRKKAGAFKLDTTISINEKNKYTFVWDETKNYDEFAKFINNIIPDEETMKQSNQPEIKVSQTE